MLFAAGKGTRMGDLTRTLPKPMIEVAGRPLIDHALALVQEAGIENLVVNVHYLPDLLRAHLDGLDARFSDETGALLETGGGLRKALPLLGPDPVFTLNSDAVWTGPNPLTTLAATWDPARMDALVLLVPSQQAIGHKGKGDFVMDAEGRLRRGTDLVYTGTQIIATDLLADVPEDAFSLNRVWDMMMERGRLFGVTHPGGWCDVGTPDGIVEAEAMLRGTIDV